MYVDLLIYHYMKYNLTGTIRIVLLNFGVKSTHSLNRFSQNQIPSLPLLSLQHYLQTLPRETLCDKTRTVKDN